jgi:NAD(P)-dependent dehydrogenase (short-subunit alcohol dehydrogenase family)
MNQPRPHVRELFDLTGRVALVTGGAGLFGRQIVEALAQAGAKTFLASRNLAKLEEEAQRLRAQGLAVTALEFDQGSEQSILALRDRLLESAGQVDILVNNAVLRVMRDWPSPAEDFAQSMAVNATGLMIITRAFGEHMAEHGRGSIINIGSIQGEVGPDYTLYEGLDWGSPPDYFFHKGGMEQLTRYVASRLGPRGVRVNCLVPGGFFNDQDPRFLERYCARTFLGRMANESDLKGAIVFLASDASAYVTGSILTVDGGYLAK